MNTDLDESREFRTVTVERSIPKYIYVIVIMLYVCVAIFTILGAMMGPLLLIGSLGSLFLAWYTMGNARVSYEYSLNGTMFSVKRRSGMRSRPIEKDFLTVDLRRTIAASWQNMPEGDAAEEKFRLAGKKKVTYNISAQDIDHPSFVLYCMGTGSEDGMMVKIYVQPIHQLIEVLRQICPGKVFINEE